MIVIFNLLNLTKRSIVDANVPCIWKEFFNGEDALMQKFPAEALPVYLRHNSADDSYSVLRGEQTQTGSTSWFSILKTW